MRSVGDVLIYLQWKCLIFVRTNQVRWERQCIQDAEVDLGVSSWSIAVRNGEAAPTATTAQQPRSSQLDPANLRSSANCRTHQLLQTPATRYTRPPDDDDNNLKKNMPLRSAHLSVFVDQIVRWQLVAYSHSVTAWGTSTSIKICITCGVGSATDAADTP